MSVSTSANRQISGIEILGPPTVEELPTDRTEELVIELGLSAVELAAWAAYLSDVNMSLELVIRPRRREG